MKEQMLEVLDNLEAIIERTKKQFDWFLGAYDVESSLTKPIEGHESAIDECRTMCDSLVESMNCEINTMRSRVSSLRWMVQRSTNGNGRKK